MFCVGPSRYAQALPLVMVVMTLEVAALDRVSFYRPLKPCHIVQAGMRSVYHTMYLECYC